MRLILVFHRRVPIEYIIFRALFYRESSGVDSQKRPAGGGHIPRDDSGSQLSRMMHSGFRVQARLRAHAPRVRADAPQDDHRRRADRSAARVCP